MTNLVPIGGASADLVDANGTLVASNRPRESSMRVLASVDPRLARAVSTSGDGVYRGARGAMHFVATNVRGTPWRLIAAVEESALYAPIGGGRRQVYWWLFAAFCAATSSLALLLMRLIESRGDLRSRNSDLARLARVDPLTEVPNRLDLEEQLARLQAAARWSGRPLSAFIIDVDRFKLVNDAHGHAAGDEVLRAVAVRMSGALRAGDVFGRWGGEEFLALLPNLPAEGTARAAERLRMAASCAPIAVGAGRALHVTVSIGCATTAGELDMELLSRADAALYRAKELGRDRVVVSLPPAKASPGARPYSVA
jgi:diguanylate cyclase (GGDEF)-like protein